MVAKLKEYKDGSKGVLIFTHKEKKFFLTSLCARMLFRILKKKYLIGMHWGHYHAGVDYIPHVDFHMAGKGTLQFRPKVQKKITRLDLCSRNFLDVKPSQSPSDKEWDILNISRPIDCKKLKEFLLSMKELYKMGRTYKVLLVCSAPVGFPNLINPKGMYVDLVKDFEEIFSASEHAYIKLEIRADDQYPFSYSKKEIDSFYRRSKLYTLFSDQEGESRVISEALLYGMPIVAWKGLRGGGLDYLNTENACLFETYENAHLAFDKILTNPDLFNVSQKTKDFFSSKKSQVILDTFLKGHFNLQGLSYDGIDLKDGLDKALPGQLNIIEEDITNKFTDDLKGIPELCTYMERHTKVHPDEVKWVKFFLRLRSKTGK